MYVPKLRRGLRRDSGSGEVRERAKPWQLGGSWPRMGCGWWLWAHGNLEEVLAERKQIEPSRVLQDQVPTCSLHASLCQDLSLNTDEQGLAGGTTCTL